MAYNPLHDYQSSSPADRPEKRVPCLKCRASVTMVPPVPDRCFACWVGHPAITKPAQDLTSHPHYIAMFAKYSARFQAKMDRRAIAVGGSA